MNAKPIMRQILESEELDLGFLRRFEATSTDDYGLVTALKMEYEGKGVFRKTFEKNTVVTKSYNALVSDFYLINMSGKQKASELGVLIGRSIEILDSIFSLELDTVDVEGEFAKDLFVSGSIVKLDRFDLVSDETFVWYSSGLEINQSKPRRPGISSFHYKVFGYSSLSISSEVKEESKNTFNLSLKGDDIILDLDFTNLPNSSIVIQGGIHDRDKGCEINITHPDPTRITIRDLSINKNKITINGKRKVIQSFTRG
jgi:hypothetical protein